MSAAATSGSRSLLSARYGFSIHIEFLARNSASIRIPVYPSWAVCRITMQFAVQMVLLDKRHARSRKTRDKSWPLSRVAMQPPIEPILFTRDSTGSRHPDDPRGAIFTMQPPIHSKFLKRHNSSCRIAQNYRRSFRRFAV